MAIYKNTPPIVTSGLILHLDAANKLSYPGSGTTWTDLSGNSYNGTLFSGGGGTNPTYDSSNLGNIVFPGNGRVVSLPNTINVSYITIGAWVKANAATFGFIVNKNFGSSVVPYSLNVGGNNSPPDVNGMGFFSTSWRNSGITTDIRGDGKWHYVVGTFDGTLLNYYIDGKLDASTNEGSGLTLPSNTQTTYLGYYANDGQAFSGSIASTKIYNRALSLQEINQNYNALKSRFGLT
jgi:hypothetical protein